MSTHATANVQRAPPHGNFNAVDLRRRFGEITWHFELCEVQETDEGNEWLVLQHTQTHPLLLLSVTYTKRAGNEVAHHVLASEKAHQMEKFNSPLSIWTIIH